jgi:multidrug resistance efflux pump
MIVFLTLVYVALLAVLVKLGVIKLTLGWKLSVVGWMLLLFLVLFLPMQWGAPSGQVTVLKYVVEVVPNVTGEVVEVPVEPLKPLKEGDILFQIDPLPFQAKVDALEAELAATIQNVEMLQARAEAADAAVIKAEEEIDLCKEEIRIAEANIEIANSELAQAATNLDKVTTQVGNLKVQVAASLREFERRKELAASSAISKSEVDQIEVQYTGLLSQLNDAESNLVSAEQKLNASRSALTAKQAQAKAAQLRLKQLVDADLPAAKANAREARLAAESMVGDEHTSVAAAKAALETAEYDLRESTVRAPSDGYVAYLSLRPGQRVASLPMRSWMAFINHEETEVVALIPQFAMRFIEPNQKAEVTLKIFPGKVFNATVERVLDMNASGQISPSGQLATAANTNVAEPYGVVLRIDDESLDQIQLSGGARGSAAIYTESMRPTHVIRKVMIRMDAWLNYIIP